MPRIAPGGAPRSGKNWIATVALPAVRSSFSSGRRTSRRGIRCSRRHLGKAAGHASRCESSVISAAAADISTRILMTKSGSGSCSQGAIFESVEHAWLGSEWPAIHISGDAKGIARDTPPTATARRSWERRA
jgi:hypothetical protein